VTSHDGFRVERDGPVAAITLDVPGKMNRVAYAARAQLAAVFEDLGADDDVRVVVLGGAGGNFTAGGDIAGFLEVSPEDLSTLAWHVAAPERCPKPVIARIEGYCLGVGLELALACDFRVATDSAQLGLPEIGLGMIPGSGGTQRLARLAGLGRAKDVIMRRQRISAADALAWGLVSEVVPEEDLDPTVATIATELQELSPLALAVAKRVLNEAYELPLRTGLELEGVEAFVEKRAPRFEGR
jgi:2-oxoglutaroyl-CoA hydrolase